MADGGETNLQDQHQNAMGSFSVSFNLFFLIGCKVVVSLQHNFFCFCFCFYVKMISRYVSTDVKVEADGPR